MVGKEIFISILLNYKERVGIVVPAGRIFRLDWQTKMASQSERKGFVRVSQSTACNCAPV